MGGCCSSRKHQLHGTPVYYYCPPPSEEHESLQSRDGVGTILSSGSLLVDLNLNMSVPDTYHPPPAPPPYDIMGCPQSINVVMTGQLAATDGSLRKPSCMDPKEAICITQPSSIPQSPRKLDLQTLKSDSLTGSAADEEEEDACPTCLEEYDTENPKIVTKCNHHFHLACILEWMERSDTCPICNQEMIYEAL